MMSKKIVTFIIIVLLAGNLLAGVGSDKMQFLKFSPSPRFVAMADSAVSLDGDVNNIFYNPAGAYSFALYDVSITYTKWFQSLNFFNFAGKMKLQNIGDVGIGFVTLIYDDIFKVKEENGALVQTDERVSPGDFLIAGNYSRQFGKKMITGANLKIVSERLDESSLGISIEAGAIYRINEDIGAGLSFLNIGIKDSPLIIRSGADYKIYYKKNTEIILACALDKMGDSGFRFGIGGELIYLKMFIIRAGYRIGDELGAFRLGVGIKYKLFQIDYSFNSYSELGNVNRIGIRVILD